MAYFLYIIYSKNKDRYYVGHTNDIEQRLLKHNSNHKGYTGKENDWVLAYNEEYPTKSEAYSREMKIKSWKSRKKIEELLNK